MKDYIRVHNMQQCRRIRLFRRLSSNTNILWKMDFIWNLLGNHSFLIGVKCGILTSLGFYYITSKKSSNADKIQESDVYLYRFNEASSQLIFYFFKWRMKIWYQHQEITNLFLLFVMTLKWVKGRSQLR